MPNRVRELRLAAGLTQQQLAVKADISRETIISLEKSEELATTTGTLLKLARALDVPVDKLFSFGVESV